MIICLFLESVPDRSSVYFLGLRWLYNLLFVRKHGFDVVETHQFVYQHIAHKSFFSLTKRLCFEMMPTNLLHILSIINIQMHHGLQVFFCISELCFLISCGGSRNHLKGGIWDVLKGRE